MSATLTVPPFLWSDEGSFPAPKTYEVPASGEVQPYTATATFDGSAAAGSFLPTISLYSAQGNLLGRVNPQGVIMNIGDVAEVSFIPPFGSAGGNAIGIDKLTSVDGTVVITNPTGPTADLSVPAVKEDGWIPDAGDTWVYATGSGGGIATFTITGNQTVKFPIGCRIKLTQSATIKYFVCAGATFGGGNTTVTIMAGTAYTLANSAITNPFYSYQLIPQGWPNWFNYNGNPIGWSSLTTNDATFSVVGGVCYIDIAFTGTSNSTGVSFSLPIPAGIGSSVSYSSVSAEDGGASQGSPARASVTSGSSTCIIDKAWDGSLWNNGGTKVTNALVTYSLV